MYIMVPFACLKVWLVRLVFSAGTVFFSHNNSAGTMFFSQFQFRPANGAINRLLARQTGYAGIPCGSATGKILLVHKKMQLSHFKKSNNLNFN